MRVVLALGSFFLVVFILISQVPQREEQARKRIHQLATHLESGQLNESWKFFALADSWESLAPLSVYSLLPARPLESTWLLQIAEKGKWGMAQKLIGEVESERVAQFFEVSPGQLWCLYYQGSWIIFTYQSSPLSSSENSWQVLSCSLSPWQGAVEVKLGHSLWRLWRIENGRLYLSNGAVMQEVSLFDYALAQQQSY